MRADILADHSPVLLSNGEDLAAFDSKNRPIHQMFCVEMDPDSNLMVSASNNTLYCFPPFALVIFTNSLLRFSARVESSKP